MPLPKWLGYTQLKMHPAAKIHVVTIRGTAEFHSSLRKDIDV
ncbi:hypothetical protein AO9_01515 [Chlamydia psittaci Mat116]|nr:hypothetical protein AO9_01515 [Chlamydia psittaci Mat116]